MLKPTISTELPGRELLKNSGNMEYHFVERPKEIVKKGSWGIRQCPKVCFCLQFIVVRSILLQFEFQFAVVSITPAALCKRLINITIPDFQLFACLY